MTALASTAPQPPAPYRHDSAPPVIEVAAARGADLAELTCLDSSAAPLIAAAAASSVGPMTVVSAELTVSPAGAALGDEPSLYPVATTEPPRDGSADGAASLAQESAAFRRMARLPKRALMLAAAGLALILGCGWLMQAYGRMTPQRTTVAAQGVPAPEPPRGRDAPASARLGAAPEAGRPAAPKPRPEASADTATTRDSSATVADLSAAMESIVKRGGVNEPAGVTVAVSSTPPEALLYRDGQALGRAPVNVTVKRGERINVLALRDRYLPTRLTIDGSRAEVVIALSPIPETPRRDSAVRKGASAPRQTPTAAPVEAETDTRETPPRAASLPRPSLPAPTFEENPYR